MKHIKIVFITILSVFLLLCGCSNSAKSESITPELEEFVSQALLNDNKSVYYEGECPAEGHIIFGAETKNNTTYVYTYISYANFGFENGNFVEVSGGSMPAVFAFDSADYELINVTYPEDGDLYAPSIKKMFPKKYVSRVMNLSDADYNNLNLQLDKYAQAYLNSISRDAVIGRMADFDYVLPTDLGISVEISNALVEMDKYISNYPYWIGNKEVVQNGVRYVYEVAFDKENHSLIYSKYKYGKPDALYERIRIDSLTGKRIE